MENKLKEKQEKFQMIINQINQGKQQLTQLEQEALMLQGEVRILNELVVEKVKDVKK